MKDFLKSLAVLKHCATRVSGLDRRTILEDLAASKHDAERQTARMLELMDDIQRSFTRIRRKLER